MTNDDIEKIVERTIESIYAPEHPINTGDWSDKAKTLWVGDKTLDYCAVRDVAIDAIREAVAQAYEEAAQLAFVTLTSEEAWDYPPLQKGAVTAASIRALKDALSEKQAT